MESHNFSPLTILHADGVGVTTFLSAYLFFNMVRKPHTEVCVVFPCEDVAPHTWEVYELFARTYYKDDLVASMFPLVVLPNGSSVYCGHLGLQGFESRLRNADFVHFQQAHIMQDDDIVYENSQKVFIETLGGYSRDKWYNTPGAYKFFVPWYVSSDYRISFRNDEERWAFEDRNPGEFFDGCNPLIITGEQWVKDWCKRVDFTDWTISTEHINWYLKTLQKDYDNNVEYMNLDYPYTASQALR